MTNIIEHTYTALANTGELHLTEKDYSTNYLGRCKSYYAYLKRVEQAENGKDNDNNPPSSSQSQNNATQNQQSQQKNQQQQRNQQQLPVNTLATRTKQAIDKKKKIAKKGTTGTIKPFSTI